MTALSIVAFLEARLQEDEDTARAAAERRARAVLPEGNVLRRVMNAEPGTSDIEDVLYLVWCSALDAKAMMQEEDATEDHYLNKQRNSMERARTAVAMIDPARVLREVEAKRAILELADEASGLDMSVDLERRVGERDTDEEPYVGDLILRQLAAVYSDHPDYDERWKP